MTSQWQRLLKNAGRWQGSFTLLSPTGDVLSDTPSMVALEPANEGRLMRQTILQHPPGTPPQEKVLEYRSLAKSVLFFDNGAFSQGSIQWGPFSEFGAELGLIVDRHRLRLVQLFDQSQHLSRLTLIREHQEGSSPRNQPDLSVDALVGTWVGEATTLYPDLRPSDRTPTRLVIERDTDTLRQTLHFSPQKPPLQSQGRIAGDRIVFDTGNQAVQVLLLPDGASSTCPIYIQPRQPLFLELGWLISQNQRQRMIRQYTAQGTWASLTLVTESRLP